MCYNVFTVYVNINGKFNCFSHCGLSIIDYICTVNNIIMEGRKSRHIRATVYLVIANVCMLLLLYGLFFDAIEYSFFGFLGAAFFFFLGIFTASDELNEGDFHGKHMDV